MARARGKHVWLAGILFFAAGMLAIGIRLIPMGNSAEAMASPDLLYLMIVAWIVRRPRTAPVWAVVALAVLADALMMRPLGLWALCLLFGAEFTRAYVRAFREQPFLLEWMNVALMFAAMLILQNLLMLVTFLEAFDLGAVFGHWLITVASYPVVVALMHWVLRIRVPRVDEPTAWKRGRA